MESGVASGSDRLGQEMPQPNHEMINTIGSLLASDPEFAVKAIEQLLRLAEQYGASDLHLQPGDAKLHIAIRVDGVLRPLLDLPADSQTSPIARLKVLAGLLTYQTGKPQEGRLNVEYLRREARVSTFPTIYGERAVVRLSDRARGLETLDALGLAPHATEAIKAMTWECDGAVILSGPAGSGKTTTMYAALREIVQCSQGGRAILTIEDPVESILGGVSQSQLEPAAGFDFSSALRSVVRQDPEVLLIGEIRDPESAEAALRAALTGHLVFTSLHAGDIAGALRRLQDLGLPTYLIRSAIRGVISQRLLRRLCVQCRCRAEHPAIDFGIVATWRAVGCPDCLTTGYAGRIPVVEFVRLDHGVIAEKLTEAFDKSLPASEVYRAAQRAGMTTMLAQARQLAETGETTPEEIFRVFGAAAMRSN